MTMRQVETEMQRPKPPHQAAPITDQDEAAAIAGAEAEAKGLPLPPDAAPALRLGKRLADQPTGPQPGMTPGADHLNGHQRRRGAPA